MLVKAHTISERGHEDMTSKRVITLAFILLSLFAFQACTSTLVGISRWSERHKSGLSKKYVEVGDHKIAYLDGGRGETIILLHGFGDAKDSWVAFARKLTPHYRVIIPDLPGFGESTKKMDGRYDIATQVARLHLFAGQLGVPRFHVAGNSMGGTIAGIYAADHPDAVLSLGLLDAGGVIDREQSVMTAEFNKGVNPLLVKKPEDFDRLLAFMFVTPPSIPESVKKVVAQKAVESHDFNLKVFNELNLGNMLETRFNDIKARTLVIWGDTDRVFPASSARVIESGIKGAKMIIIKDCGHLPMVEKPEESSGAYLEFIRSLRASVLPVAPVMPAMIDEFRQIAA